ncbi:class C sortase [Microbacterium sp.]|uniref:class C sortase n=1 Tax=Microbacterium sp. TaxID=51671 RepID=UPI0039E50066
MTDADPRATPRWRPGALSWAVVVVAFIGMLVLMYPTVASWLSSQNQSLLIREYTDEIDAVEPSATEQLRLAHEYNDALSSGVRLDANAHVPVGDGVSSDDSLDYWSILSVGTDAPMARIRIPAIDVDLPIYHGTADDTLLRGAGHLEGSHLPVGGPSTHAVITAHRGLANATMFSDLDEVVVGDTFTIEVFGEVLTYRVREKRVVEPEDTDTLRPVEGEDLVTLVTCTPLGINSHRILVTGERVTPTPVEDVEAAGDPPDIPGFPWWAVVLGAGTFALAVFLWRSGYTDARARARRLDAAATDAVE